jgi:hypothetical protein
MTTAAPLARYGAMWKARVASGSATALQLHHVRGHDPAEGRSVMLEEYARQMIYAEELHAGEVDKMLRKPGEISTTGLGPPSL